MKRLFLSAFAATFLLSFSFSFTGQDVNNKLNSFAKGLNMTLANAATQQNVYSSAWIGKLFPSAPPHFAIGVEAGVTKFDLQPLKEMAQIFGVEGIPNLIVYPTITANARVGGFVLPFDIGFSAMYLDFHDIKTLADGFSLKFFDIGGDIRWAILKGEGPLPQVSVGVGYYYIGGKVNYSKDGVAAGFDYVSHTLFCQAQISKTFIFFTPYLGVRGILTKSNADWNWAVDASKISSSPMYQDVSVGGGGKTGLEFFDKFMPQVYGGFGMNFAFFALNLSAAYEFTNNIWGADLSLRFQM